MRRWMRCAATAGMVLAAACAAQDIGPVASPSLTVWVVKPVTAADRAFQQAQADLKSIATYRESTSGSFGTSAGSAGQTAGSYGTSASNVGRNASDVGQTAGSYGVSTLPSDVKSQTAGSYGTTAGSIGTNASDYTGAPTRAAESQPVEDLLRTTAWRRFVSEARSFFAPTTISFVEIPGVELHARLAKAGNAYPDILLLPPTDYPGLLVGDSPDSPDSPDTPDALTDAQLQAMVDRVALRRVGRPFPLPVVNAPNAEVHRVRSVTKPFGYALGMVRAPHAFPTRQFLEWLDDDDPARLGFIRPSPGSPEAEPAKAAVQITETILSGGTAAGLADTQMAQFTLANARSLLYGPGEHLPADLSLQTAVMEAKANDRFAVVLLHVEIVSAHAYGQLFPLVVLRRVSGGSWKVLHLSIDLPRTGAAGAFDLLSTSLSIPSQPSTSLPAENAKQPPAQVTPVSLAAPRDGEQRAAQGSLELWWDDRSNARVLVVEYQSDVRGGDILPHLFVVDDREPKLETRVTAPFGAALGPVRWRVWSVGQGGNVQITPWQHVDLIR